MDPEISFAPHLSALAGQPADLPPPLAALSLAWAFLFGACWGSFANVVIARVPAGLSVVRPRSRCPACGTQIAASDNIPILSWVLLRGRCRACGASISWRYPFVELLAGLIGLALVARYGWSLEACELFTFAIILMAIAFIDVDTWTVPHPMWIALTVGGVGFGIARAGVASDWSLLADRAIGGAAGGAALAALVVGSTAVLRRTGRLAPDEFAMGWGDPLIMLGIGAFLGFSPLPAVVFLASLQGSVVGLVLKARGSLRGGEPVSATDTWVPPPGAMPFGPFLAIGALEVAFFGDGMFRVIRETIFAAVADVPG